MHDLASVTAELGRVRRRPAVESAPPVLAEFTVEVAEGFAAGYPGRVRQVLLAALELARTAEFGDEDLPTDGLPDWFVAATDNTAYRRHSGGGPWSPQGWLHRFDPDDDSRGWEFWDVVPVGASQVRVWVDSWGESFFGSLELLWLLYTAGGTHVEGPGVHAASAWAREAHGR
ncbi:hypothetical protein AB0K92_06450 [Streptomyces sp. NPDC052687]|uniref:hypothetical protein n=1 Tax=Streptomyces sp. NPDC052687 TaxID=3154759 RepID=UPI00343E7396